MRQFLVFLCLSVAVTAAAQTTTFSAQTGNNTAACSAAGTPSYCQSGFNGMTSSSSGTYNAAPGNVGTTNLQSLLYAGNTTKMFTYLMPWFCMNSGSAVTGSTSVQCQSHIQVGYNSNDAATVAGQASDMIRRGFQGVIIDWYGPYLGFPYDQVSQKFRANLNGKCSAAQSCPLLMALMEDQGSFEWADGHGFNGCPQNGGGVDQTNCILTKLESDMDYMNQNYFGANSYLKVDNTPGSSTYMQPSSSGKPVVLFFICEECWTNPSPNWTTIWNSLRTHTNSYVSKGISMFFIFRNSNAFSHVQTNGGYAWVNWYGTDPFGLNYLNDYYSAANSAINLNPRLLNFGGGWKGFDESNAPWVSGTPRVMQQQCGNTWLQTLEDANNYYNGSSQLPFAGAVTWNDYEEGTEIETGIDNCMSLRASVSGSLLSWTPTFSASTGSENTITGYNVYSSTDGTNLTQLTTVSRGTHLIDLSTFSLANGTYKIYVQAEGQPSILNKMSNAVSYAVGSTTGTVKGTVTDSGGTAISGATVQYSGGSTTTASNGTYTLNNVPSGIVTVTASATGYNSSSVTLSLTAGTTMIQNFSLTATTTTSPPPAPTGLTATSGNAQVSLAWTAVSGATSYKVYRGTTSGGETALTSGVTTASYTDNAVTNGTTYYYKVSAVNGGGEGPLSAEVSATPTALASVNVAAAANGGVATASSTYSSLYPVSAVNDGDREGLNWGNGGGWNDATVNTYPDWVQIAFNGTHSLSEIDVFTLQDNYTSPVNPTRTMTFTQYGITAFEVQYWNGSSWVDVPGGNITNNNLVWTQFTFSPISTNQIRVLVNNALNLYSRIVEVEAWGQ